MLSDDLKEFLRFLNEEKVEYLLIGGWAVGYHGYPRLTQDMDVWVEMRVENTRRILKSHVPRSKSEREKAQFRIRRWPGFQSRRKQQSYAHGQ
jgi:hypothetical protein